MTQTVLSVAGNHYIGGGSDRYKLDLEHLLERSGRRVVPLAAKDERNETTPWARHFPRGANIVKPRLSDALRFIYNPAARNAMRKLVEETAPSVAHLHIYYGKLTSSILRPLRQAGIPIVQTLHDFKPVCPVYSLVSNGEFCEACRGGKFWHALPKRCNQGSLARSALSTVESYASSLLGNVRAIDRFIAVSHFHRKKLIHMGLPEEKVTTIHNFVDAEPTTPTEAAGDHVLYFGRLDRNKGLRTLLQAARQLPETRFLIAGSGPEGPALEEFAKQNHIRNVEFVGFKQRAELQTLLDASICTVLPTEGYELCPMSILESFAHARPVIGARTGGIPELIDHGVDGLLFTPGASDELANCLEQMVKDASTRAAMGAAGRSKVETRHHPEVHLREVLRVYEEVGAFAN